jgi:hypothetical protein
MATLNHIKFAIFKNAFSFTFSVFFEFQEVMLRVKAFKVGV